MKFSPLAISALAVLLAAAASRAADEPSNDVQKSLTNWIKDLKAEKQPLVPIFAPKGFCANLAIKALIESFLDNDWQSPEGPTHILAAYSSAAVPHLVEALKNPDPRIRANAADTLRYIKPKPKSAIPVLMMATRDNVADVRENGIQSLGEIGLRNPEAFQSVVAALEDQDTKVRREAVGALHDWAYYHNWKPRAAIPALMARLKDTDPDIRAGAAHALGSFGPAAKAAVPALFEAFTNRANGKQSGAFASALGAMGSASRDAVPALAAALESTDVMLQRSITMALGDIGPDAALAVPALITIAKNAKSQEQWLAIRSLGQIGPAAEKAVPVLIAALSNHDHSSEAALALSNIGPAAKPAVPKLIQIACDRSANEYVRKAAGEAVAKIDLPLALKLDIKNAYLDMRVGSVSTLRLEPRPALTEAEKREIKSLIGKLAELDNTVGGHDSHFHPAFSPLPQRQKWDAESPSNDELKRVEAFRRLVAKGPAALPFLLEALDNSTPTRLSVPSFDMGGLANELKINPLNFTEKLAAPNERVRAPNDDDDEIQSHSIYVGDLCFEAIGQIVGRPYQPLLLGWRELIINSPVRSNELRDAVRAVWSSNNPEKRVLDSLLFDFAIREKAKEPGSTTEGDQSRGFNDASDLQCEAAMRLLYFFPKESVPLIADRLKRLDVARPADDNWTKRTAGNGVYAYDFLDAVSWCEEPAILDAMLGVFQRTDLVQELIATLPSIHESHPELIIPRVHDFLGKLPASERVPKEEGFELLVALGRFTGKAAIPEFENYLKNGSSQRRWTMCCVVGELRSEWAIDLVAPMLTDQTMVGGGAWRLCDEAADAIAEIYPDLKFDPIEKFETRSRQIEAIRERITRKRKEK